MSYADSCKIIKTFFNKISLTIDRVDISTFLLIMLNSIQNLDFQINEWIYSLVNPS